MAPPRKSERTGVRPGGRRATQLTVGRRNNAIDALQDRLRPQITDRALLETYLRVANWDVDRAYNQWQADREAIMNGRTPLVPGDSDDDEESNGDSDEHGDEEEEKPEKSKHAEDVPLSTEEEGEPLKAMRASGISSRFNASIEQERRDAALALCMHVESETMNTATLSPSEAVLLLHRSAWDLGEAVASFTTLRDARLRLRRYDRMRSLLPEDVDRNETDTMRNQDERLAEFANITGRPDWYSLRMCLEQFRWNLIEAVQFWFLQGVAPVHPPPRFGYDGIRVGTNLQPLDWPTEEECQAPIADANWGVEPDYYTPDDAEPLASNEDSDTGFDIDRPRPKGFLVCNDVHPRGTAKKDCPNPTKFLVESISKGRYWFNRFLRDSDLRWPEIDEAQGTEPADPNLPVFDWKNQKHVDWLNNWRRQGLVRATGIHVRFRSQRWSQEEIDFLIQLTEELYEEAKQEFPDYTDDQLLPLLITTAKKKEWTDRMNEKFTGTIQDASGLPHKDRKEAAIMTQRGRTKHLIDRYKVTPDKKWFAAQEKRKTKAGEKRKRSSSQEANEDADKTAEFEDDEDADETVDGTNAADKDREQAGGDDEQEPGEEQIDGGDEQDADEDQAEEK